MSKVTYEDGTIISFEGDPTPQDIEEAYNQVKGVKQTQPQLQSQPQSKSGLRQTIDNSKFAQVMDYVTPQLFSERKYPQDQFNIYGDIANRLPAAARSVIQGQNKPVEAFQRPSTVPTMVEALYLKQGTQPTGNKTTDFLNAYPAALVGTAMDTALNPFSYIGGALKGVVSKELPKAGKVVSDTTKSIINSQIGKITQEGIKKVPGMFPQIMNKNYVLNRAKETGMLLDDTKDDLGKIKGKAIDTYGDITVDKDFINSKMPSVLPSNVVNRINDPLYAIEKLPDGSIKPTISNMDKLKGALGDFMTGKDWEEATTKNKQVIKQVYGIVSEAIKKSAPKEVSDTINNYHDFMDIYRLVNKTVRNSEGTFLDRPLKATFKPGAERAYQIAWNDMQRFIPRLKQIMTDVTKYDQRQNTKMLIKRVAPWIPLTVGGGYMGMRWMEQKNR